MSVHVEHPETAPSADSTPHGPLRIFFVAGESSGDLHGANLIREMVALDPESRCEGLGGARMAEAGMKLRYDLAADAIMGFTEVVRAFPRIRRLFHDTVNRLDMWRPHCLVLIDYPGFNIRLARAAHALGIPVVYYISPQVWAWKKGRVHTLASVCTRMLVVFPFEKSIYDEAGLDCVYVGHPLVDHLARLELEGLYSGCRVVGILPGSREQEIRRILPVMLETARGIRDRYPDARFIAPCVDAARERQIRDAAGDFPLETAIGQTYEVLSAARFCLVASGTATVETAMFGVPMVIMYRVMPSTYWLAKRLVRVDHVGMVNILAGRRIVPEFIQGGATVEAILPVALTLMDDTPERERMCADLKSFREIVGGPGASARAAEAVLEVARRVSHG